MKIKERSVVVNYESRGLIVSYTPTLTRKEGIKVKKAVLKLQVTSASNEEGYLVKINNSLIDKFYGAGDNGNVTIDVSEKLQDLFDREEGSMEVVIENATDENLVLGEKEVIIDYISKKTPHKRGVYKDVEISERTAFSVNLNTGKVKLSHRDFNGISHEYSSLNANKENEEILYKKESLLTPMHKCGKGWKLNLQQYLIKEENGKNLLEDNKTSNKYIYIDGKGNEEEFLERFYYKQGEEKVYLDGSEVSIDTEGKLSYQGHEVESEIVNEGELTLVTYLDDFKGVSLIERDNEEISSIKEEIKNLASDIDEYEKMERICDLTQLALDSGYSLSSKEVQLMITKNANEMADIESQRTTIDMQEDYFQDQQDYLLYIRNNSENSVEKNLKTAVEEQAKLIEERNIDLLRTELTKRGTIREINEDILTLSMASSGNQYQLEYKKLEKERTHIQMGKVKSQYRKEKLEEKLKKLEEKEPIYYIVGDNAILGFAKTGTENVYRLVCLMDNYENIVHLEYEGDSLININNGEKVGVSFEYEDDLLVSIKDSSARKIKYEYQDRKLMNIIYPNGKTLSFNYDDNDMLITIENKNKKGYKLEYSNKKVSKISRVKNEVRKPECEIVYIDRNNVEYKDSRSGKLITYVFNNNGDLISSYENKFEGNEVIGNVNVVNYENSDDGKSFVIATKRYGQELLEGIAYSGNEGILSESYLGDYAYLGDSTLISVEDDNENEIITVGENNFRVEKVISGETLLGLTNKKDFIFSGWAKANSFEISKRSSGELNDEIDNLVKDSNDTYKKERRYELRVEITYLNDGIEKKDEYYSSYDYLNENWQYCAIALSLSEDPNDILKEIRFIFDYSNNNGVAYFTKMSLKEGEWEYKEYNEDKQVVYLETSKNDSVKTYEYEDKLLVKEVLLKDNKEYITRYEYDLYKRLIRSICEYNGLVNENEYDDKGQLIKTYTYYLLDPSLKIYSKELVLDEKGNEIEKLNEYGIKLKEKINHGYDVYEDSLLTYRSKNTFNICEYNEDNLLAKLEHNDINYNYYYDDFDNLMKVTILDHDYLDIEYSENETNNAVTSSYVNGDTYISYYDKEDKLIKIEYRKDDTIITLLENIYDTYDNLISCIDVENNITYTYEYDSNNRLIKKGYNDSENSVCVEWEYDKNDKLVKEIFNYNGELNEVVYSYDDFDKLIEVNLDGKTKTIKYDNLSRIKVEKLDNVYTKKYDYLVVDDHTNNLINKEEFAINNIKEEEYEYEYDENLNIVRVNLNKEEIVSYQYDELSRLIREDNKQFNKTLRYYYDNGGNIISRVESEYKNEEVSLKKVDYKYSIESNKDLLLFYEDKAFSYDELGYPIVYKDVNLIWDRTRLKSYDNVTFTYKEDGKRLTKVKNNIITKYYYENDKLLVEDNGNLLLYKYDENGVIGFKYESVGDYHYKKNIMGDVLSIMDNSNIEIVKYVYDAYGNHKTYVLNNNEYVNIEEEVSYSSEGLNNKLIAQVNPFRYRSYYYDNETGLYYVLNRYYDPQTARFISPDSIEYLDSESFNGLNLYAYCLNNPVMNVDFNGRDSYKWYHWAFLGVGLAYVAAGIGILALAGKGILLASASLLNSTLIGAAKGALLGAGVGVFSGVIGGSIYSVVEKQDLSTSINQGIMIGLGFGALNGALAGAIVGYLDYVPTRMIGFTKHGYHQTIHRDGGIGVNVYRMQETIASPKKIVKQYLGFRHKYIGKDTVVVLNKFGKVVTTWAVSRAGCWHPRNAIIGVWLGLRYLFNNKD